MVACGGSPAAVFTAAPAEPGRVVFRAGCHAAQGAFQSGRDVAAGAIHARAAAERTSLAG